MFQYDNGRILIDTCGPSNKLQAADGTLLLASVIADNRLHASSAIIIIIFFYAKNCWFIYFASAAVAVDSSHMTASSSAS